MYFFICICVCIWRLSAFFRVRLRSLRGFLLFFGFSPRLCPLFCTIFAQNLPLIPPCEIFAIHHATLHRGQNIRNIIRG